MKVSPTMKQALLDARYLDGRSRRAIEATQFNHYGPGFYALDLTEGTRKALIRRGLVAGYKLTDAGVELRAAAEGDE